MKWGTLPVYNWGSMAKSSKKKPNQGIVPVAPKTPAAEDVDTTALLGDLRDFIEAARVERWSVRTLRAKIQGGRG